MNLKIVRVSHLQSLMEQFRACVAPVFLLSNFECITQQSDVAGSFILRSVCV